MSETISKVEVITGVARGRRFATEQKLSVVNEALQPGMLISHVAVARGSPHPAGDAELTSDIRRLVDAWPSDGYRRIAALLKHERQSAGHDLVKRVYRLMKKSGLLLARHTGRRIPRAHDGTIVTCRANERSCSAPAGIARSCGLPCPDSHDRDVIAG